MKKLLSVAGIVALALSAFGANPSFQSFRGTNNIRVDSNTTTGIILVDGVNLQPLSARLSNLAGNPIPFTNWFIGGVNITLTTNASGQVTITSTAASAGFAALEVQTNSVRVGLGTNIIFVSGITGFVSGASFTLGVSLDTNTWNSRQGGSLILTNLAGNPIPYTNILAGGTGITLTTNSGVVTIAASATSFGMLVTNIFTTNIQGSPVIGTLWFQGTVGSAPTNGARTAFEYTPSNSAVRIGSVIGNGQAGITAALKSSSTYSNYWDHTNTGVSTLVYGSNNMARGDYSSILGGRQNVIETNAHHSFIGAGAQLVIQTNSANSAIVSGTNNMIVSKGIGNFIGAGGDNIIQGAGSQFSTIGGGFGNQIGSGAQNNCENSFIGGGVNIHIYGAASVIGGGSANNISSFTTSFPTYCFIGGGQLNDINAASSSAAVGSTIGGGEGNDIGSAANGAANDSVISGGINNFIDAAVPGGVSIGGGAGNTIGINAHYAVISGGKSNVIGASLGASFILGGVSNNVSGASAGVIGWWTSNSVASTIAIGVFNTNKTTFDSLGVKIEGYGRAQAGKSGSYSTVGGTLTNNSTAVASAGAAETNLMSFTVVGNTMTNANDRIRLRASGRFAATANAKQIKLIFGSETIFDTTSQIVNSGAWTIDAEILRTGTTSQSCNASYVGAGMTLVTVASSVTLAQTNGINTVLKLVSTAAGDGDVTNRTLTVEYHPNF